MYKDRINSILRGSSLYLCVTSLSQRIRSIKIFWWIFPAGKKACSGVWTLNNRKYWVKWSPKKVRLEAMAMKAGLVTTAGRVVLSSSPNLSPVAGCGVRMLHIPPACSGRNATTKKHRTAFWERFEVLELAKPVLPAVEPPTTADLWRACPKEEEDK